MKNCQVEEEGKGQAQCLVGTSWHKLSEWAKGLLLLDRHLHTHTIILLLPFELFNTSFLALNPTFFLLFRATTSSRSKEYINATNAEDVSFIFHVGLWVCLVYLSDLI